MTDHNPEAKMGDSVRWIDMTAAEIADLAHRQLEGNFGSESDATTALHLIEALAHRLKDQPHSASATAHAAKVDASRGEK